MASLRATSLLLLCAALGCGKEKLTRDQGVLRFRESELHIAPAWTGYPAGGALHLDNTGRAPRSATLSAEGPATGFPGQVTVPGGGVLEVPVELDTDGGGPVRATLHATGDWGSAQAALAADPLQPPTCPPDEACATYAFRPEVGDCAWQPSAEGQPCSDICLTGAACKAGHCVGVPRDCSDGNPCTLDSCDPGQGCTHLAGAQYACPVPADPCQVPLCDLDAGCNTAPAQDGTPCGRADCVTSQVCLDGACRAVPTPEGGSCGETGLCQRAGRCQGQTCVMPPPDVLPVEWSWDRDGGGLVLFPGLADEDGNLYWLQLDPSGFDSQLLSATPRGRLRYQAPAGYNGGPLLVAGGLVVGATSWAPVEAHWAADGGPAWGSGALPLTGPGIGARDLALDGRGRVVVALHSNQEIAANFEARGVVALSLDGGAVVWSVDHGGNHVSCSAGICAYDAYVLDDPTTSSYHTEIAAANAVGQELWSQQLLLPSGLQVLNGAVAVMASPDCAPPVLLLGQLDGAALPGSGWAWPGWSPDRALLGGLGQVLAQIGASPSDCGPTAPQALATMELTTSALQLSPDAAPLLHDTVLTASGSVLGVETHWSVGPDGFAYPHALVWEVAQAGVRFRCELPGRPAPETHLVLRNDRLTFAADDGRGRVGSVVTVHLPGLTEAAHGWTGYRGGSGRTNAPH